MKFSNSIREHSEKNLGITPTILLRHRTPCLIVELSRVEAIISSKLEPIEWIVLGVANYFSTITRLEPHIISGFALDIIEEILEMLLESNHLELINFNRSELEDNLKCLTLEVGDDWKTPNIERILDRVYIKQFKITEKGKNAFKVSKKEIQDIINLNLVITGYPFKLFFDKIQLKQQGYDIFEPSTELIRKILHLSIQEGEKLENKLIPLALGGDSVINSYEVVSSDIWVSINLDNFASHQTDELFNFSVFLTSSSFVRWSNPRVNYSLNELLPTTTSLEQLMINGLSKKFSMIEDIILETLNLQENQKIWTWVCDLEMLKLIRDNEREPIEEHICEVSIPVIEKWELSILLTILPEDELAKSALYTARFHAKADRTGFIYNEGHQLWNIILDEANQETTKKEFNDALKQLENNNGLKKSMPKVSKLVVDLDELFMKNQQRGEVWKFNRIRELEEFIKKSEIQEVYYYSSEKIESKIDEEESLKDFSSNNSLTIVDVLDDEVTPAMRFAADNKFHYLGFEIPKVDDDENLRLLRIERRVVKFKYDKTLIIDALEPIYHWYPVNIIDLMYEQNYSE
jgi:transcriptional regulator CtsR